MNANSYKAAPLVTTATKVTTGRSWKMEYNQRHWHSASFPKDSKLAGAGAARKGTFWGGPKLAE
eukprot:1159911-Pelagomonas_calceolata.AAC.7